MSSQRSKLWVTVMLIVMAAAAPAVVLVGQEIAYSVGQGYDDGYGDDVISLLV